MINAHEIVIAAALRGAAALTVAERAMFYRGLAEICGSDSDTQKYLQLAASLEEIERAHLSAQREFGFAASSALPLPAKGGAR